MMDINFSACAVFSEETGVKTMLDIEKLINKAMEAGFTHAAKLDAATIHLLDAVRDMCSADRCGKYGKNWSCPPGCGSIEECRRQVAGYKRGILVQTVGELDDPFDYEGMMAAEKKHKDNFVRLCDELAGEFPGMLALGAGSCTRCRECSYPDAPCRQPDKRISSMEAYGMMVMDVCRDNGLKYNYGSDKVAFTGCFLLE